MEFGAHNNKYKLQRALDQLRSVFTKNKRSLSMCLLCNGSCESYPLLCNFCLNDLPTFHYNVIDNDLLNWPAVNKILPKHTFDHLYSLSPHIWPYNEWINLLKYHGRFDLTELLANLLHQSLLRNNWYENIGALESKSLPLMMISVPLHLKKWQIRGYNQAHLLTTVFSRLSNIQYVDNGIYRKAETESQVGKSGVERRKNIKNAFELNPLIHWPEHVVIIDDVITTGTTVNEISSLLKSKGVKVVTVLTITIALPEQ